MAKFLATTGVCHLLDDLIKAAEEKIVLVSPYLKLNDRLRELLAERSRSQVKIQIIYGKRDLDLNEQRWLREVPRIKVKFRKNLHAKCYLTEKACIITSLNLHEFSQQNNDEMGVLVIREDDPELYRDAAAEVAHIVRGSRETNLGRQDLVLTPTSASRSKPPTAYIKLSTSKLALKLGMKTTALYQALIGRGLIQKTNDSERLTALGKRFGGEEIPGKNGGFVVWPPDLRV